MIDQRILVVTHRKELIEQNHAKMMGDAGIYSAGVGRRDRAQRVIVAGVQSIYKRMDELQAFGKFNYVIVDEAHLVPPVGNKKAMYARVFAACGNAQRIGLTATPYRLNDGPIFGADDSWFTVECYSIGIRELTDRGYLSPLVGVRTAASPDLTGVKKTGDDYNTKALSIASSKADVVSAAVEELCYLARDRRHWLLFAVDRLHAAAVKEELIKKGIDARLVFGNTPKDERTDLLSGFKAGAFRALVNVGVLTTGFDAPCVDCVGLFRATLSKSLCVQMLGRGTRLDDGKKDCLLLDFGGNLERHIPLDGVEKTYRSPALVAIEKEEAEKKERAKKEMEARHGERAARDIDPLSDEAIMYKSVTRFEVIKMSYKLVQAKRFPGRHNLIASYKCRTPNGGEKTITQFICVDYPGRAGDAAKEWFSRRGLPKPLNGKSSLQSAWQAPIPTMIAAYRDGNWDRVVSETFT